MIQHNNETHEIVGATPSLCSVIRTTKGDIDSSLAGIILPHEHLLMDFFDYDTYPLGDPDVATAAVSRFVYGPTLPGVFSAATGRTIVEVSTRGLREDNYDAWNCAVSHDVPPWPGAWPSSPDRCIARDAFKSLLDSRSYPLRLADIATYSGANVVMGTGAYWGHYHPIDWYVKNQGGSVTYTVSEDQIFSRMVSDIRQGVDGTSVRAGVIGEIGISWDFGRHDLSSPEQEHTDMDEVVLKAACRAHLETGAAINIHFHPLYPDNLENNRRVYDAALEILRNTGCTALDRIIFGHFLSTSDPDVNAKLEELAAQGVNLEFDLFGNTVPPFVEDGSAIAQLIEKGYVDQLLASQDIYYPKFDTGYSYIVDNLASYFKVPHAQTGTHVISGDAKVWLADISGDGKADFVVQDPQGNLQNGSIFVALRTDNGFDMWTSVSSVRVSDTAKVWLADVNGDGKADLVVQGGAPDHDHGKIHVALSTGTGFSMWASRSEDRVSDTAKVWLVDVDGDGKADLVAQGGPNDYDHGQIYVALSNRAGNGFEMWTSRTEESLVDDNGRVWFQNIAAGKAAEMVYLPGNNQNNYDMLQYFSHPIGVSARDMQQIMVVNARRILEITVPCGQ